MSFFITKAIINFCVAFGVVFGAALLVGVGAVLTLQPPKILMLTISDNVKIWAVVAAIGGTIDPIRAIESHVLDGAMSTVAREIVLIVIAFLGAQLAFELIRWICKVGME